MTVQKDSSKETVGKSKSKTKPSSKGQSVKGGVKVWGIGLRHLRGAKGTLLVFGFRI